ncbi:MAG: ferritin-like domain-containing protein [Acidimicrobiales bacterium]
MSTEPSYLPLLRQIVNGECNAEVYLSAWAETTPRADVRQIIATVALREGEHAKAFEKRICELGHDVAVTCTDRTNELAALARDRSLSDLEKFQRMGLGTPMDTTKPDRWATYFDDQTIDIGTGELLGRFVSEERDSVRLLADCFQVLSSEPGSATTPVPANTSDRLDRIESLLEALSAKLA